MIKISGKAISFDDIQWSPMGKVQINHATITPDPVDVKDLRVGDKVLIVASMNGIINGSQYFEICSPISVIAKIDVEENHDNIMKKIYPDDKPKKIEPLEDKHTRGRQLMGERLGLDEVLLLKINEIIEAINEMP